MQARLALSRRQQQPKQKGFSVRAEAATAQSYGKAERVQLHCASFSILRNNQTAVKARRKI